jgi:ureidoglycolate lyase
MERHPLGSQAFVPLNGQRYVVVVAPAGAPPSREGLRAFLCRGDQGINYHRGTWHHPMLALDRACEFAEFHRIGPGANCDEAALPCAVVVQV